MASHSNILNISIHSKFQEDRHRQAIQLVIFVVIISAIYEWSKSLKTPYNNSKTTGAKYINFLLTGNPRRCQNMLWLTIPTFELLAEKLSLLDTNPVSKLLSMEEQLGIFMFIVGQGATNRQAQDRYQHSGETISKVFHHLISLIIRLAPTYIKCAPPGVTHPSIIDNVNHPQVG